MLHNSFLYIWRYHSSRFMGLIFPPSDRLYKLTVTPPLPCEKQKYRGWQKKKRDKKNERGKRRIQERVGPMSKYVAPPRVSRTRRVAQTTLPKHLLGASPARSLTLCYFIKLEGACLVG